MADQKQSQLAVLIPVIVALIGLVSSPVWGPSICQAIGVCHADNPTPAPTSRPPSSTVVFPSIAFPSLDVGPASIFLSSVGGPAGSRVNVSGTGFSPRETIVIRFHTDEVARTTADTNGAFKNVVIEVPAAFRRFAPQQFEVVATGQSSIKSATAPYMVSG